MTRHPDGLASKLLWFIGLVARVALVAVTAATVAAHSGLNTITDSAESTVDVPCNAVAVDQVAFKAKNGSVLHCITPFGLNGLAGVS